MLRSRKLALNRVSLLTSILVSTLFASACGWIGDSTDSARSNTQPFGVSSSQSETASADVSIERPLSEATAVTSIASATLSLGTSDQTIISNTSTPSPTFAAALSPNPGIPDSITPSNASPPNAIAAVAVTLGPVSDTRTNFDLMDHVGKITTPITGPAPVEKTPDVVASTGAAGGGIIITGVNTGATGNIQVGINEIYLSHPNGRALTNVPLQFGRAFVQGEFPNSLAILVDNTVIATQVDVKNRWPDGSIKFAILSTVLPSLAANAKLSLKFRPTTTNSPPPSDVMLLLNRFADFDATLSIQIQSQRESVSARNLLNAGKFQRWTSGPISESFIVADHSASRGGDIGGQNRPLRAIFHVTFWPTVNKVFVRFIGEASNLEALQDLSYSLTLTTGRATPQVAYSKADIVHFAGTRWTRTSWVGGEPEALNVDHNLSYLAKTRLLPNYDTTIKISEETMVSMYAAWAGSARHVFEKGLLDPRMMNPGGRAELGLLPTWHVLWLYTGDARMREIVLGNADLSSSWALAFREGVSQKIFTPGRNETAEGRVASVNARPTFWLSRANVNLTSTQGAPADRPKITGSLNSGNNWIHDLAHQPDLYSVPYLLTGDFWYLEQMQFWASWSQFNSTFASVYPWSRGPDPAIGLVSDEIRGEAWATRNRALAAVYSPDNSVEKTHFEFLTRSQIAYWEGIRGVTGGVGEDQKFKTIYDWASRGPRTMVYGARPVSVLGLWSEGLTAYVNEGRFITGRVSHAMATWQDYYISIVLNRLKELDFNSDALLRWQSKYLTGLTTQSVSPYLTGTYVIPSVSAQSGLMYTNWRDLSADFDPNYVNSTVLTGMKGQFQYLVTTKDQLEHGYPHLAMAAASGLTRFTDGPATWSFFLTEVRAKADYSTNPKWALLPR